MKEEEQQEAESLGAVVATIGVPEEVADDPVATEDTEAETKVEPVLLVPSLLQVRLQRKPLFRILIVPRRRLPTTQFLRPLNT